MTLISTLALAGAMFLLAATPGPGVFATLARALASGFSHAAMVAAGIVLGDLLFLLLAVFGLAAVATLLGDLFTLVRFAGGAYIIWLGWRIWHTATRPLQVQGISEISWRANFLSGFLITLGNPKVILFYLGFLPTFIDLQAMTAWDLLLVAVVVSVVLGGVLLGYAYTAAKSRHLFGSTAALRRLQRGAGGAMMAAGTALVCRN
jgi:threonine/homoserine/homoserine lactone efflux protein